MLAIQAASQLYQYQKLKSQYTIRLLELQPSTTQDSEELFGELVDVDLQDEAAYEAASHAWEAPVFNQKLFIGSRRLRRSRGSPEKISPQRYTTTKTYLGRSDMYCGGNEWVCRRSARSPVEQRTS